MNRSVLLLVLLSLLTACLPVMAETPPGLPPTASVVPENTLPAPTWPVSPTEDLSDPQPASIWLSPALPEEFRSALQLPAGLAPAAAQSRADLQVVIAEESSPLAETAWVYALVAPFPTLTDTVDGADLRKAWLDGGPSGAISEGPLLVTAETRAVLEAWWGKAGADRVQTIPGERLLETAWAALPGPSWAIIPFEAVQPRWKVLRVDGISPLDNTFDPRQYALSAPIQVTGEPAVIEAARQAGLKLALPANRDPQKLSVLALTGVTALSRQTAETMEAKGLTYPGRDIAGWLKSADLAHISNEVSFMANCPKPGPTRRDMRFCSSPEYIELLESVGTDIVELTGNHLLDWGFEPFLDSLEMYHQRGWAVYGGGANLALADQTLRIEHNGNRLAFIGCSPAGPANVWATIDTPGSAPCDWNKLEIRIAGLLQEGWLPVVTLQGVETDGYKPAVAQSMPDYRRLASAGAVVVSGSQSHYPQTMTFVNDSFVHYGLGNLFFDQMDLLATRQGFIDRHVFYNGRYMGVELLTTLIEDYARPRPMTPTERSDFLNTLFTQSEWNGH